MGNTTVIEKRKSPFHGGNMGSTPIGDAKSKTQSSSQFHKKTQSKSIFKARFNLPDCSRVSLNLSHLFPP